MTRGPRTHPAACPAGSPAGARARVAAGLLALGVAAAAAAPAAPQPPELPAETLASGGSLAAATTERVYVIDIAINHIVDGRLRVFDARAGRLLGMINTGYAGNFALSARADELYIATTYLSRGGRGERTDVLEVWDTDTLQFRHEIVLPPKRAQTLNYRGMVGRTAGGRFLLVQNATPATSITVVDLAERKVAGEVPTPGCWGTLPAASHPARFAMLCGDGKLATVTLDERGQVADRQVSDKLFDADQDAWFATSDAIGDRHYFVSFKGVLSEVDVGGPAAVLKGQKNFVPAPAPAPAAKPGGKAAAPAVWRPGGYQVIAVHPSGRWAVVPMHDTGREGSHKTPAKQLWVIDLDSGRRVATAPGMGTASLAFSRSGRRLQALDGTTGAMHVWDWGDGGRLKKVATVKPAGEAALHLESHD